MGSNQNKNIVITISVIFLFLAMLEGWTYGFFTLLRCVVFGSFAYLTWLAYTHEKAGWSWIFGFIALLFNPIIPIGNSQIIIYPPPVLPIDLLRLSGILS